MAYFLNMSYIVFHHLAKFELDIILVHGETKKNIKCIKGKLNQMT
jgi:hypothetical protein